jgi:hypothetical protein
LVSSIFLPDWKFAGVSGIPVAGNVEGKERAVLIGPCACNYKLNGYIRKDTYQVDITQMAKFRCKPDCSQPGSQQEYIDTRIRLNREIREVTSSEPSIYSPNHIRSELGWAVGTFCSCELNNQAYP